MSVSYAYASTMSFRMRLASTMARAVALDLGTSPPAAGKYVLYYAANCPFAHIAASSASAKSSRY